MGKIACICGHVISNVNQSDDEQYWGSIIPNGEEWTMLERAATELAELCEHYKNNTHKRWLDDGKRCYTNQPIQGIISDLLSVHLNSVGVSYARCEQCGALRIQKNRESNNYISYASVSDEKCEDI